MKKAFSMLTVLVLLLTLFSSSFAEEGKPDSISVLVSNDLRPTIEYCAELFSEKYGINVEIISQAYDNTHDKIMTAVMGGSKDDVVYIDNPWCAEFATNGIIVPIDEYMTDELTASLISFDHLKYDGHVWGLPSLNEGKWLFYNAEMLAEAGFDAPPSTWEEMESMTQKMVSDGIAKYGITWAGLQAEGMVCDFTHLLNVFGGSWVDENGDFTFNSKEAVDALSFYCNTYQNGTADPASITYNDGEAINPFLAGDVPFAVCWSFLWSTANDATQSQVAGKVDVARVPGTAKVTSSSCSGSSGYGVLANSDAKEWAFKFIEMLTSEEVQEAQLRLISSLPVTKVSYEEEALISEYPFLEKSKCQLDYMGFRPSLANYTEWSQIVQECLHKAVSGLETPQEALDEAYELVNNL